MTHPTYTSILDADWSLIPPHMIGGMRRYIEHGIAPGGFLVAVFSNDLVGAFCRADDENVLLMRNYVTFLYYHAPPECWGSKEKVAAWCKAGGLVGQGWRASEGVEGCL